MELIIAGAGIVTMAPGAAGLAESMLVRDGVVAAVGPAEAVRAAAGPGAAVLRLDGATVVPGLIDAHCHVSDVGYLAAAADCGQPAAPDIPAIQARFRDQVARTPEGSWVTGAGYVEYKLREQRHPTRADLDAAVPDRPAVLYHTSLHACVLNTAALRAAGFDDTSRTRPAARSAATIRAASTAWSSKARCSRCSRRTCTATWVSWAPPSGPGWWTPRASGWPRSA